jgi:uncharacterized DUF497 family protein
MDLEWDDEKRALTLTNRGLDFAHADKLFGGLTLTVEDDRFDYGETRFQTIGRIGRKTVLVVWTPRGEARRIISMRECNVRERERYESAVG